MSSEAVATNTEAAILARLIRSRTEMNPEIAQYLLSFKFDADDVARINLLSERAQEGTLSAAEMAELDSYLHVGNLLTVMQSKARVYLKTLDHSSRQ